jgi:hypothetical protein
VGFLDKITGKIGDAINLGRGNEDLAENGIKGRAAILDVTDTGRTIGLTSADGYSKDNEQQIFEVRARITLPGREPYEVTQRTTQAPTPGEVDCFVDPKDDQRVYYQETVIGMSGFDMSAPGAQPDYTTALGQSLATDPAASQQLRASLSALLGRPVGESPEELAAAMQESQEVSMKMAQQHLQNPPASGGAPPG